MYILWQEWKLRRFAIVGIALGAASLVCEAVIFLLVLEFLQKFL
jgi:hypothetical protein